MKIAVFAPIPPQNTGIADYVFHWLQGMSANKAIAITLFSNSEINRLVDYPVQSIAHIDLNELAAFDLIIYHIGNHEYYHGYMIEIIKRYPGLIHLHDVVLYHSLVTKIWHEGGLEAYLAVIEKHYGKIKRNNALARFYSDDTLWQEDNISDFPLFEEFVQYATACIVHSQYAAQKINTAFPQLPVHIIPQLYRLTPQPKTNANSLQIGVFGGVETQKKVDSILKSLSEINRLQQYDFTLHIVGGISSSCDFVYSLPAELGLADKVCVHGRVDEATYSRLLNSVDLIIALRQPTMGETSAVVMQALQLHIPVIVTNTGWYNELPDFIDKISVVALEKNLTETLLRYFNDPTYLDKKVCAITKYAEQYFNFDECMINYQAILRYHYGLKLNKRLYKKLAHVFNEMQILHDDRLLASCLEKMKAIF
jgi:glycosyltransferase involved in cell wall biosynthesis